jgi:hypothetical protein
MVQKKVSIKPEQEAFLAACKEFGFPDQSSVVRAALDDFIKENKRKKRRIQMGKKAQELSELYHQDNDLAAFNAIDGDDFYETGNHLGNKAKPNNRRGDS